MGPGSSAAAGEDDESWELRRAIPKRVLEGLGCRRSSSTEGRAQKDAHCCFGYEVLLCSMVNLKPPRALPRGTVTLGGPRCGWLQGALRCHWHHPAQMKGMRMSLELFWGQAGSGCPSPCLSGCLTLWGNTQRDFLILLLSFRSSECQNMRMWDSGCLALCASGAAAAL